MSALVGLERTQRVAANPDVAPESLGLLPHEYFVLSRIDRVLTVGEVIAMSGLRGGDAERILERLVDLGAVVLRDDAPPRPNPTPANRRASPSDTKVLRERATDRRRRMLEAQLAGARTPDTRSPPAPAEPEALEGGAEEVEFERFVIPLVPEDDPRIDPSLAIPVPDQRWLLALCDQGKTLDDFSFLGLAPTHDLKAIRRAYHETSRRLHPDAYYGKNLGSFQGLMAPLFKRAKKAHASLQKAEYRNPYVDRHIEERARRKRMAEQKLAAQRALDEMRRRQEEAEAAERRQRRAEERARRERERVVAERREEAARYRRQAEAAAADEKWAAAANFYRLALRADPTDVELQARWQEVREHAKRERAAAAFARGRSFVEIGQLTEAAALLVEAAEAHPTVEHLAHAADAVRRSDAVKARNFALAAFDALQRELASGASTRKPAEQVSLHLMIGRAFLAAGQTESARHQAMLAEQLRPDDPEIRALLKSIKVN